MRIPPHVTERMRHMNPSAEMLGRAHGAVNEADDVPLSMNQIRDLALRRPGTPVLSLYLRTDPRDPANTAAVPRWLIELRNSLREVSREVDMRESRGRRMAIRELRERVERDVLALEPAQRGRGLAWFRTADGSLDHRFTLQLPPLRTLVRWDDRPYVSPLAEVAERGRPPAWYFSARRLSGCCTGRTAGSPNPPGRYMRSSQASGAIMTPTSDIPAGHPPACTSPSSTSESANGGSGSCAPPPRRSESRSPAWAGTGCCWPANHG
jgi:hypothetical protein